MQRLHSNPERMEKKKKNKKLISRMGRSQPLKLLVSRFRMASYGWPDIHHKKIYIYAGCAVYYIESPWGNDSQEVAFNKGKGLTPKMFRALDFNHQ